MPAPTDLNRPISPEYCSRFHRAVELVGKRWNGPILRAMLAGHSRYSDIRNAVPNLSDTLLAQRLKQLESEGLVERFVDPGPPLRTRYMLTPKGGALYEVVRAVEDWSHDWLPSSKQAGGEASPAPRRVA